MSLEKQVHIYSVDTSAFYYCDERKIHKRLQRLYSIRFKIATKRKKIHKTHMKESEIRKTIDKKYTRINKIVQKQKNKLLSSFKKSSIIKTPRILNDDFLVDKNVISVFDSTLTRVSKMKINELSSNLIVVQTFFFDILKDITMNGFIANGEKYVIYTASAGQIRTKKTVFIKESVLNKYENTLTCGMTNELINKRGTININKYLAYRALQNSATDKWEGFDIDKTIVVEDFESDVDSLVDYIDDKTYIIERKSMKVPIPHTDGAGMMLPNFCKKSRMCRSPWIKGLLIPFDFKKFILENKESKEDCNIVKDIYGVEHDVIKENIKVIFTKSQFKMWKHYNSWEEYKENFKKYNCEVGYCNEEEDVTKNAKLNYQMLQTLTDISDDELDDLSKKTVNDIINISSKKETMLDCLGATIENGNKNNLQKSIQYYPPLLNDFYSKHILKQIRRSMVKNGKAGKIKIEGKYTFICPDLYAFSENLFLGIENPNGLLEKNEVSCNLYSNGKELDCLRSPHLYLEHCVRKNKKTELQEKWFISKGIYTSCKDIISKILVFDVDGDKSLVCSEKTLVEVAKRNIEKYDVVPLHYNMKKAGGMRVDKETIYNGMISAYTGGNIGMYSNNITKIWNSENIDLDTIRLLCLETNFCVDHAKTLYKPTRPSWAKDQITKYTKNKVPYFFLYAKDKNKNNVEPKNNSTMNRLNKFIKNPSLDFTSIDEKFDYKMLMNRKKISLTEIDEKVIESYNELDLKNTFILSGYDKKERVQKTRFIYSQIKDEILKINSDVNRVSDVLVRYLYTQKPNNKKIMLWECFGDDILNNLIKNLTKDFKNGYKECESCGVLVEKTSPRVKYCKKCGKINKQNLKNKWSRGKSQQKRELLL